MFRLLSYFSLTSAVVLVLAVTVLVAGFRQHEINELIDTAEKNNVSLAHSFANTFWPRFSPYLKSVSEFDGDALRARPETREIHEALKKLTAGLPVLKVKIYSLGGIVLYSSEPSQIGEDKSMNPGFMSAARHNTPASKLTFRDTFSAFEGKVMDRDLVASYLPIRSPGGSLEGVFELYTDVSPLLAKSDQITVKLGVGLPVFFMVLYGALFLIVGRADGILKRQRIELEEAHDRLEDRVEERTRKLRKSDVRFKNFAESTTDRFWEMDENFRFTQIFSPGGKNSRPTPDELLGRTRWEVFHYDSSEDEGWHRHREDLENHRPFHGFEHFYVDEDGKVYYWTVNGLPVFGVNGEFKGYQGTATDITDRKRAEDALVESEERYRSLVELSPDAIFVNCEGLIVFANLAAMRLFGARSAAELIGKPVLDFSHPDYRDVATRRIRQVIEDGERVPLLEVKFLRLDGAEVDVEVTGSPFQWQGRPAIQAIVRDITDRKRAEQDMLKLQTGLAHISRVSVMGEMAAGMAHEINQPLTAILNYAQGSLDDQHPVKEGTIDFQEVMSLISEQAQRANNIIHRIRNFIRKEELEKTGINLNEVIRAVTDLLGTEIHKHRVTLYLELADSLPEVKANRIEIQQVVMNLMLNGIEAYSEDHSRPRNLTARTSMKEYEGIEVAIHDNGAGIPSDIQERIFDPFFTTKSGGLGMGLVICRTIIENHDSRLRVIADAENGTTFHFTLPFS